MNPNLHSKSQMSFTQQDPLFKKMYQKSFLLKKYKDLQIPLVKKQPGIKNHILTTFLLATCTHFLIYPLDTLKTRLIASNKISDIANFSLNKTKNQTAYLGFFRGYFSVILGNAVYLSIGKQNFVKGAVIQALLRTWVDMMKISKQMANTSADLTIMSKSFGWAAMAAVLRDLVYRGSFLLTYQKLNEKYLQGGKFDYGIKTNNMFVSVVLSTILNHPLEVCFTKIASQRQLKYRNILSTAIDIYKQEGVGKLCASGLWPRVVYNITSASIMFNFYDKALEASLQAF